MGNDQIANIKDRHGTDHRRSLFIHNTNTQLPEQFKQDVISVFFSFFVRVHFSVFVCCVRMAMDTAMPHFSRRKKWNEFHEIKSKSLFIFIVFVGGAVSVVCRVFQFIPNNNE